MTLGNIQFGQSLAQSGLGGFPRVGHAEQVPEPERFYGVAEAAEKLGLVEGHVRNLICGGILRSVKVDRRRLVPESALTEYFNRQRAAFRPSHGLANFPNPPRCECHDCTQARYRGTMQWQVEQAAKSAEREKAATDNPAGS